VPTAIIAEAVLSFLGLGVQPPAPSWGTMLNVAQQFLEQAPWMALWPGVAIFSLALSFNLAGDGLRDALDPRAYCDGGPEMAPKPPAFGAPRRSRGAPLDCAGRGGVTARARVGVFCATFSIVGRDAAGDFGVAVSTARPAVGALVPHVCL